MARRFLMPTRFPTGKLLLGAQCAVVSAVVRAGGHELAVRGLDQSPLLLGAANLRRQVGSAIHGQPG